MTTSILCSIIEWKRIILCELIALVTFNLIPGGAGKGKRRGRASSERAQKKSKPKENNVKWQLSQKAGISDSRSPVAVLVSVATS